jgi:ribose transport system permease protein
MNKSGKKWTRFLVLYSRPIILVVLLIFFSIVTSTFWSINNWSNVLNIVLQQLPFLMLLTVSMIIAIILGGIDLSIGASVALITCGIAFVLQQTYNPFLGIVTGLVMGLIIGFINGILIAKVKVSAFIATYSMQWILRGIALVLLGGKQIYDLGPDYQKIFTSSPYTFLIISAVVVVVMWFIVSKTVLGNNIYAIGKNINAARISGIKTDKVIIASYTMSGVVIAIVSILYLANVGAAEPITGTDYPLRAIAAALIGGTAFGGGMGKITHSAIGAMIMLTLTNGMIHLGVPSVWQQIIVGAVIIVSIIMERGMQKLSIDPDEGKAAKACN